PGQAEVIERVVAGDSTLVVFPTGQGKSLCYQLPALHLSGLTLVVSPLMALMKDQVDFLVAKGVAAARLDSSLDFAQIKEINERLRAGSLKILYVAPERFANERFVNLIKDINISLMVVDEAHCISEWGHNFRPDYLKLAELAQKFQVPTVLALTATATPEVADDIRAAFAISEQNYIKTGFYRPNLTLRFAPSSDPFATLIKRLAAHPQAPTIVYVTLQKTAEQVAKKLSSQGYTAMAYHAGLKDEKRQQIQEWFMAANDGVVVATIAFGMGIDKANIRYVYHYNLPKSLENYAQEIGRAGRDGEPSICEVLGGSQDLISLENFVYGDTPEVQAVHDLVAFILAQDKIFDVGVYELSSKFDIRPLVVKTLLTYLELDGFIAATGPFYGGYKFKPLRSSQEIFKQFDPERVAFLTSLFSCAEKAKIWFTIDLQQAIQKTGQSRQRIIAALDYLAEQGDLDLQVSNSRLGYRKLIEVSRERLAEIQADICRRFDRREEMDLKRLQTVVALVN
ncbi:ATP-dependent DNA helicase RecQ, partial [hydrothermal vent metagenome]